MIDTLVSTGANKQALAQADSLTWEEALDAILENVDGLGHIKAAHCLSRSARLRLHTERIIASMLPFQPEHPVEKPVMEFEDGPDEDESDEEQGEEALV